MFSTFETTVKKNIESRATLKRTIRKTIVRRIITIDRETAMLKI